VLLYASDPYIEERDMTAKSFITHMMAQGRYCFRTDEAAQALDSNPIAVRAALRRLREKGDLAMPYKGFYVIVEPEYRVIGCLPASHFIPSLMEHLGEPYYAGVLSAAEFHGAAHQRPQVFQVVTVKNRPGVLCGKVRVEFIARKNMEKVPVSDYKTPRGYLKVSTPEATAFDVVGYPRHAAGLDNAATVLAELAEKIDSRKLVQVAGLSPIAWSQRLGYLLELAGGEKMAKALAEYVAERNAGLTLLDPAMPKGNGDYSRRWRVVVNATVDAEA
jgi:predicted transcriptional regulator of viral defense system